MKSYTIYIALTALVLFSCDEDLTKLPQEDLSFQGKFNIGNSSPNSSGAVTLDILDGHYSITTNENPYSRGAGKVEINANKINFIDTLFSPIPAIYSNTSIPHGEYSYTYDGEDLKIWKKLNTTTITYSLKLK